MAQNQFTPQQLTRIRLTYAFALSFIAVTLIASSALMWYSIHKNSGDARVINLSGRQRMLSQRITKCALALARQEAPFSGDPRMTELSDSLRDWTRAHRGLQFGDSDLGLPVRQKSPRISELFAQITPFHTVMVGAASNLLSTIQSGSAGANRKAAAEQAVIQLLGSEQSFLKLMDKITFQFDQESRGRIATLEKIEVVILLVGLGILTFEFWFVFRPSITQLGISISELVASRQELQKSNESLALSVEESKRLAEMAQAANRTKSEFLANMSHEIRTPMNAILGFSEILFESLSDQKSRGYAESIRNAGKSLLRLINDILDLSKVEAGKLRIVPAAFDLYALLRDIQNIFAQKILEKRLEMFVSISPDLPKALISDETRLRQILLNLVGNAVKFTESGSITVSVKVRFIEDDPSRFQLVIQIADTGVGIDDEHKNLIFGAFEQRPGQDHAKYGGTGLGLAISRRLAELLGGTLTASDNPAGRGSVFTLTLDRVPVASGMQAEDPTVTESESEQIHFEKAVVLIADDIEVNRQLLRTFLEKFPFEFLEAEDGRQALDLVIKHRPAVVLTDIKMPFIDGYQLLCAIKSDQNLRQVFVIAVTASLMGSKVIEMQKAFDAFLQKPVTRSDLIRELARFLPYHQVEKAHSSSIPASLKEEAKDYVKLCHAMCEQLTDEVGATRKTMRVSQVKALGGKVSALGKDYGASRLEQIGGDLSGGADRFDLPLMRTAMEQLASLLKEAESQVNAKVLN